MHGPNFDIDLEHITKIEGHAGLDLKVRKGKVTDVRLKFSESKRFYTQAMRGKMYASIPSMVSHICGTCSIAHITAAIEAVEHAIGATPSEQTLALRKLSLWGLNLRDHAMHLYLFCLPDIYGIDSVLDFKPGQKELIHQAFHVKSVGNELCTHVIGAAVHPMKAQVGRFTSIPDATKTKQLIHDLIEVRPFVLDLIDIFAESDFKFVRDTLHVAVRSEDYSYLGHEIHTSDDTIIHENEYFDHLTRVVMPYSQGTGFMFHGKDYMVGALSRMNLHRDTLHPDTRRDAAKALSRFPSSNIHDSNVAQAVEMLNAIDRSADMLESLEFKPEPAGIPPAKEGTGIGAIEAPRGTLYYMVKVMADGRVQEGMPVIPTAQNQINIQNDVRSLVQNNLHLEKGEIEHEIEKLIRSYDPCVSCATHFLKVKWDVK